MKSIILKLDSDYDKLIKNKTNYYIETTLSLIAGFELEKLKIFIYWSFKNTGIIISNNTRKHWKQFIKYLQCSKDGSRFAIGDIICLLNNTE